MAGRGVVEPFRWGGLGPLLDRRLELPTSGFPFLGRQVLDRTTLNNSVPVYASTQSGKIAAFPSIGSSGQTRAVLSSEAVTTRLPSGLNAAELTSAVCPWREASLAGVGVQTRAVVSPEAVTTRLPSGLNAARRTYAVCPWSGARVLLVSASQTRAVLSSEAVTTRLPSGLNAAE